MKIANLKFEIGEMNEGINRCVITTGSLQQRIPKEGPPTTLCYDLQSVAGIFPDTRQSPTENHPSLYFLRTCTKQRVPCKRSGRAASRDGCDSTPAQASNWECLARVCPNSLCQPGSFCLGPRSACLPIALHRFQRRKDYRGESNDCFLVSTRTSDHNGRSRYVGQQVDLARLASAITTTSPTQIGREFGK